MSDRRTQVPQRRLLTRWQHPTGPWGLRFNPFLIAQSGKPFNIILPTDPLNDFFNERPTYASSSTPLADQVATPYGLLDKAALPGEKLVGANIGNGPAAVAVNLRVSRGFGIGPKVESNGNNQNRSEEH